MFDGIPEQQCFQKPSDASSAKPDAVPMPVIEDTPVMRFRTIWISDIHLGTTGCQAELLLEFLKHTESTNLFLVVDDVAH